MKEEFIGCWYYYIHSILKEKSRDGTMNYKDAKNFLFQWRIPNFMKSVVMRELELLNLITRIDKNTIKIEESKINIENPSAIYDLVGLIPNN